jgi:hypothetical protein
VGVGRPLDQLLQVLLGVGGTLRRLHGALLRARAKTHVSKALRPRREPPLTSCRGWERTYLMKVSRVLGVLGLFGWCLGGDCVLFRWCVRVAWAVFRRWLGCV